MSSIITPYERALPRHPPVPPGPGRTVVDYQSAAGCVAVTGAGSRADGDPSVVRQALRTEAGRAALPVVWPGRRRRQTGIVDGGRTDGRDRLERLPRESSGAAHRIPRLGFTERLVPEGRNRRNAPALSDHRAACSLWETRPAGIDRSFRRISVADRVDGPPSGLAGTG